MHKLKTYVVIHKYHVVKYLVQMLDNSKIKHSWNYKQMINYISKHNMIMVHKDVYIHSHLLRNLLMNKFIIVQQIQIRIET